MKKGFLFLVILIFSTGLFAKWTKDYSKFPIIKLFSKDGKNTGSSDGFVEISITDAGKYTGQICPGVTAGFIMTKIALEKLYNGIAEKGEIKLTGSKNSGEPLGIAVYITGANFLKEDVKIDPSLVLKDPMDIMIIFERKDTGKKVKVVYHKGKLFGSSYTKLKAIYKKMEKGKATETEKGEFAKGLQEKVTELLTAYEKGIIEVIK